MPETTKATINVFVDRNVSTTLQVEYWCNRSLQNAQYEVKETTSEEYPTLVATLDVDFGTWMLFGATDKVHFKAVFDLFSGHLDPNYTQRNEVPYASFDDGRYIIVPAITVLSVGLIALA